MQQRVFDLLRRIVPRVPPDVALSLAVVAGGLAYRSAGTMRAAALHNISNLLDRPETDRRVRRAALGAFCTLTRNYVDMLTVPTLSADALRERTDVCGMERLLNAQARGRGVLIATAHVGNVDAAGHAIIVRGARAAVLTERVEPDWLFEFFVRERSHFGGKVVPLTAGAFHQVQRLMREGYSIGIACDWDMQGNGVPITVPSFRHTIRIPVGIALLAARGNVPIVPVWPERLPDGNTRVYVEPECPVAPTGNLRADVQQIAAAIAHRMLPYLRARPHQWVLFHPVWDDSPAGTAGTS